MLRKSADYFEYGWYRLRLDFAVLSNRNDSKQQTLINIKYKFKKINKYMQDATFRVFACVIINNRNHELNEI